MPDRDVLMMIAEDGRVIEWQRLAEELFGWSAEEAVGQSVVALMREIGAGDRGRRGSLSDGAPVLVRPVLHGTSVVWQVRAAADAVSQQDVAVLKAMFTQSPVGIYVLDNQLRVVRMNTGTRWLRDTPVADLLGKRFTEAFELEDPEEELAVAHRVMESGVPVLNRLVRASEAPGPHRRRIYSISFARLEGDRGTCSVWWRQRLTLPSVRTR